MSFSVLLSRSGDPRYLHSFPTRRSSDLYCPCVEYLASRAARGGAQCDDFPTRSDRADDGLLNPAAHRARPDRKSTRLNSSHTVISYAVFCLKKKKHTIQRETQQRRRLVR